MLCMNALILLPSDCSHAWIFTEPGSRRALCVGTNFRVQYSAIHFIRRSTLQPSTDARQFLLPWRIDVQALVDLARSERFILQSSRHSVTYARRQLPFASIPMLANWKSQASSRACNESRCYPSYCANRAPRDQEAKQGQNRGEQVRPSAWCRCWIDCLTVLCFD